MSASENSVFEVRILDVAVLCENTHLKHFVFGETTGPAKNEWSTSDKVDHTLDVQPDYPEVKTSVVMATKAMVTRYPDIAGRIERFSDWFRAKRAVASASNM